MKKNKQRHMLLGVWLGFFLFNVGQVVFYYVKGWIEMDNFKVAMTQLSAMYAPYLGVMLLFYWGKGKGERKVPVGLAFGLALVCSVIWNGLLGVFLWVQPIEDAVANVRDIGGSLAWLVAGAIGYYFAQNNTH
jgi:hypothetical protein